MDVELEFKEDGENEFYSEDNEFVINDCEIEILWSQYMIFKTKLGYSRCPVCKFMQMKNNFCRQCESEKEDSDF